MFPNHKIYTIWPSVVPADRSCNMIISPCERAFLLFEGEEYTVQIMAVNGDEKHYHEPTCINTVKVTANDGILRFNYCFEGEQEYTLRLIYGDKILQTMTVYSLYEDLYALRPLRGDLHAHSYRSDGRGDPAALAGHFREQGYDFFALTDHNRFYPGEEIDEVYDGVNTRFTRVRGEEVHTPGSDLHIVHVGGAESITSIYVHERERYEAEVKECIPRVPQSVPAMYVERYAMAMWATDKIHSVGGLAIFPHPYWRPQARIYNVNDEFSRILLKSGMFDAFELAGGMGQQGINRALALWGDLRAEGANITVVGSSDIHGLTKSETFPDCFSVVFAKDNSNDSIIEAVKSGLSVAAEANGYEYDRQYRFYGQLRLVSYALFLIKHYFPERQRLCQGEGVAMRAFAMNEASAELVEKQAELSASFEDRFFGKKAPILPDSDMLEFENKWRKTHIEVGPPTKGSSIDAPPVTRQI